MKLAQLRRTVGATLAVLLFAWLIHGCLTTGQAISHEVRASRVPGRVKFSGGQPPGLRLAQPAHSQGL